MDDLRGALLGDYRLKRPLAEGGTASVWSCVHQPTAQVYAIKVLASALRDRASSLARLMQEGRAIQSLRHEHIVRVFDHGVSNEGIGWVVMELLDGLAIDQLIDRDGPFDADRVIFAARQVCSGLAAAHARSIFHRDIKPANIMLVGDQRHPDFVKVLDFGVARLRAGDPDKLADTAQGMTLGTPQYMSPEQAQAHDIDGRSDLYQVGLLMWEMLVGEPPFDDPQPVVVMRMHLQNPAPSVRARRPDVSPEFEAVILRCLAKKPDDRYATADALGEALDRLARHDTGSRRMTAFTPEDLEGAYDARLPGLGNPTDESFALRLEEVLAVIWPQTPPPQPLLLLQAERGDLADQLSSVEVSLAQARASVEQEAARLEHQLGTIDGAIQTLELERAALENDLTTVQNVAEEAQAEVGRVDREFAAIYRRVESGQAQLYGRSGSRPVEQAVDFGALFRENIDAQLEGLIGLVETRSALDPRLEQAAARLAAIRPRLSDLRVQLVELERSRLAIQARRVAELAPLEASVLSNEQTRARLIRRRAQVTQELALAFRQAVRQVIDIRERGPGADRRTT